MEQHVNNKLCYKLGRTVTIIYEILMQVYRTEPASKNCIYLVAPLLDEKKITEDERLSQPDKQKSRNDQANRHMLAQD